MHLELEAIFCSVVLGQDRMAVLGQCRDCMHDLKQMLLVVALGAGRVSCGQSKLRGCAGVGLLSACYFW